MQDKHLRKAIVLFKDKEAGVIEEIPEGYRFTYAIDFIKKNQPISVSLPLRYEPYEQSFLFSFFVGLLPEGWYLEIVCKTLKIDKNDSFGILLSTCQDTIGAVTIKEIK